MTHVRPSPERFQVALDTLVHDAALWDGSGGTPGSSQLLRQGADTVRGLVVPPAAWLVYQGIRAQYDLARVTVADLLRQGSQVHQEVATSLIDARNTYLRSDQVAEHDFNQIW